MERKGLEPGEQLLVPLRFDEPSQSDSVEKSTRTRNLLRACSKPRTENQDQPPTSDGSQPCAPRRDHTKEVSG